ncbi:MAG: homoprotocatechuate degradation operon regulator HpaR [Gammaproteobacteria bacterium]|jgi:homoprotocatechuate degradation regulator HpaR|nr:homoprotocatechuate degradation operon regulator HpaR [Gammaproteobacteria bacterium]MCP4880175.1 homoprotocatechuate degradation operon regulator HpaR [Gammaproteobacteria bacterium]MDP6166171.1 homoprotocatechuate degradation operon regulator HpaR [Gammaproteobacteria bacterium]
MQPKKTDRALPLALLRARETVMYPIRSLLKEHDITDQQWRVLRVLHESGSMDAKELAKSACVLAPSLTRIIKNLEEKGFLTRCADGKDGRRVVLEILPQGKFLIESVTPEVQVVYEQFEARYGKERLSELLDLLHDVVEQLDSR